MSEHENGFSHHEQFESDDITEDFLNMEESDFMDMLSQRETEGGGVSLHLHISDADPIRLNKVMSRFPGAKVTIATSRENYQLDKDKYQGNIDWKFIA